MLNLQENSYKMARYLHLKTFHLFVLCFISCSGIVLAQNNAWINEFHYDNNGADTNESVEIIIENPGTLSDYAVVRYNGNGGVTYGTTSLDEFTAGQTSGSFTVYSFVFPSNGLQNGPDGFALTYEGTLVSGQFLSYEGAFTATNGPANGITSTDVGVAESGSTLATESLQLTGTGSVYNNFAWSGPSQASLGNLNAGQAIGAGANIAPEITNIVASPEDATSTDVVTVNATITDAQDNIDSANLSWGLQDGGPYPNTIGLNNTTGTTYETSTAIPAQMDGTTVYYTLSATDDNAMPETAVSMQLTYTVNDMTQVGFQLNDTNFNYTINFDTSLTGINEGGFTGDGLSPAPSSGQLDSNTWLIEGLSDGDSSFGDTNTSSDFTGTANFGAAGSGINSYTIAPEDYALGFQPAGSDLTPGIIAFRFQNNTGEVITNLQVAYDLYVYNDEPRSNSVTLVHGTETDLTNSSLSTPGEVYLNSPEVDDLSPSALKSVLTYDINTNAAGDATLNIAPGETYIIAWQTDDVSGGGSRDEFAIDNIQFKANATTPGFSFIGGPVENLILGTNYTILNETDLFNELRVVAGTLQTNNNLTLRSTADQQAYTGAFTNGATVVGDVTVEKYIPGERAFRILSSPVHTSSTIQANWQEGATSATQDPNPGYGIHITGSETGANGFDASPSGNASAFTLNNATQAFEPIPNTNIDVLEAGKPFLILIRGSRAIDVTDNEAMADDTVLRTTGTLELDAVTQSFTTTAATQDASGGDGTFFLFGNPFARTVDMNAVFNGDATNGAQQNLNPNFYYIFDPQINGDNGRGGYVTIDLSNGSNNTTGVSAANGSLQAYQGGFAQIVDNTPGTLTSITFGENAEGPTGESQTNTFYSNTIPAIIAGKLSRVESGISIFSDGFKVTASSDYTSQVDLYDAQKLANLDENIAIAVDDHLLAIEKRDAFTENTVVQLHIDNYRFANYELELTLDNVEIPSYLHDRYLDTVSLLESGENHIAFTISDNEQSSAADRFAIIFNSEPLATETYPTNELLIAPNPFNDNGFTIRIPDATTTTATVQIVNVLGQIAYQAQETLINNEITISKVDALPTGIYYVKVKSGTMTAARKLIKN